MLILPAIDIRGGRVVRLLHGRFDAETDYGDDPVAQARAFAAAGARALHVVDLDGAKEGTPRQTALVGAIAAAFPGDVQAGGGIRALADVEALLTAGVARVVVGSLAATQPQTVREWAKSVGIERLTVALDVHTGDSEPIVLTRGWQSATTTSIWSALDALPEGSIRHLLVTDTSRDGAMTGPNLWLLTKIIKRRPDLALQASGGVRDTRDVKVLAQIGSTAAILGRALYDRALTLEDALAC